MKSVSIAGYIRGKRSHRRSFRVFIKRGLIEGNIAVKNVESMKLFTIPREITPGNRVLRAAKIYNRVPGINRRGTTAAFTGEKPFGNCTFPRKFVGKFVLPEFLVVDEEDNSSLKCSNLGTRVSDPLSNIAEEGLMTRAK